MDAPAVFANGSLNCGIGGSSQPPGEIQVFLDWYPATGAPWGPATDAGSTELLMHGHVPDGMGITGAEIRSPLGTTKLPLYKGYFLTWIAGATATGGLPVDATNDTVVATDSQGHDVAQVVLKDFIAQAKPSS